MRIFYITSEYIELVRLLNAVGPCGSVAEVRQLIGDGFVTVNGQVETRKKCKILPGQVVVTGEMEVKVKVGR